MGTLWQPYMGINGQFSFSNQGEYSDSVSGARTVLAAIDLGQIPFIWWSCRFYRRCQLLVLLPEKDTVRLGDRCPKPVS